MKVYKYTKKSSQWVQYDNLVLTVDKKILADGAKVLYGILAGYKANGRSMTAGYLQKVMDISPSTYEKYIRQLKALDFILIVGRGSKSECYVGTTTTPASVVKRYWAELTEDDTEGPLTLADLKKLREDSTND